jgi:dimethylargininase
MRALVREVSPRFAEALSANPLPIDVALAQAQHAAYCDALAACGAAVIRVPGDVRYPDCCFLEDTAVIAGKRALITRPGAPSRRGEVDAIEVVLRDLGFEIVRMAEPATLDGGDCMRVGQTIYVGRSARTNAEGIAALAAAFPDHEVITIALPAHVLHLKCVVSPLDDQRVLLASGSLDPTLFPRTVIIPTAETYAANCVAIGGHAILADGFPEARASLERAGLIVHAVPTSEVRKADGSLTCQSILLP